MKETTNLPPQKLAQHQQVSWQNLNEPGAYVEAGTGNLYRFPPEALIVLAGCPARESGWRAPGAAITRPVHHELRGQDASR